MSRFQQDIELPQAGRNVNSDELSQVCQRILDQELQNAPMEGADYNIDLQVTNNLLEIVSFTVAEADATRPSLQGNFWYVRCHEEVG